MKNLDKFKQYMKDHYDFDKEELTVWDYAAGGVAVGLVLAMIKSITLVVGVALFIGHMTFKK
ncbi:hypothetical protein CPT_Merlin163 [Citrobacter phage Merlin]|uniref:Uncharacterized protein n=1 Tax=Citrobacter phage Merlin TaxID=1675602 RepID=A0A0K1LMW5_9CAUD|nr:hypothetical protein CPT_Merlin163 [Citrobacter phage Merlin]AKU43809.1 hypothetical protein CPT_Merlin163 [Citrobacter phage Merlin]